jgi:Protein of unknown function (DUF3109)
MFVIGEAALEESIMHSMFSCDVETCKGACCTLEGGRGAPLEDDEILEIGKWFPVIREYLSAKSIATIERRGMYDGGPGGFATTCINDRECVFVYFDNGIARCAFERAFLEGKTDWRKPISCHLFPLRIHSFGKDIVRYERIDECHGGRVKGKTSAVPLFEFLREPLTRKYGEDWYNRFAGLCRQRMADTAAEQ